jgi:hypothetical protein
VNTDDALNILAESDDKAIARALVVLREVLVARSRARGDIEALVELGFERGFTRTGEAVPPWLEAGVLICPGSMIAKSAENHDCIFVSTGDEWVWKSGDVLIDVIRRVEEGGKHHQRSITLLAAADDLTFDVVTSKKKSGTHALVRAASYRIDGDALRLVTTRAVTAGGHR